MRILAPLLGLRPPAALPVPTRHAGEPPTHAAGPGDRGREAIRALPHEPGGDRR